MIMDETRIGVQRRKAVRVVADIPVDVVEPNMCACWAVNLSLLGVFLDAEVAANVGELVKLRLFLDDGTLLTLRGKVVRKQEDGTAVEFVGVRLAQERALMITIMSLQRAGIREIKRPVTAQVAPALALV
jgi:hypothetical protein